MLKTSEVEIGLEVEVWGERFVVISQHPRSAHWWLQRVEDGAISVDFFAHAKNMTLVGDFSGLRETLTFETVGGGPRTVVVRESLGEWVIFSINGNWRITHRPTAYGVLDFPRITQAKKAMADLHEKIEPLGNSVAALKARGERVIEVAKSHL